MKKTTKKTTKKETFTQEAAEKLYENILEMEDTMQKLGADMDKVRSGRLFYMTNHFDITEDEAKEFLDKMEKKETKAEEKKAEEKKTLTKDTDKIEISSCANCYTPEDGIIHGTMTVADLKALDWKKDKNGIIAFDNGGKIRLNFYRIKKNEPALSVWSKDQGGSTLCDVTLTDKQGRQHIMEVRAYLYERNCKKDQANTQGDNWDWWGIKKFSQFVKEVTGYEL